LTPIILNEQANEGRTIIEKFEEESQEVSAVIVLLSGDDICIDKENQRKRLKRARQNVVFELGYFIGKFGRKKVIALRTDD